MKDKLLCIKASLLSINISLMSLKVNFDFIWYEFVSEIRNQKINCEQKIFYFGKLVNLKSVFNKKSKF